MKSTTKDDMVERLIPRIEERVTYRVIQSVIDALEEQFYPPEEMIREELIDEIFDSEKRIERGKGKILENSNELKRFLDDLKAEE